MQHVVTLDWQEFLYPANPGTLMATLRDFPSTGEIIIGWRPANRRLWELRLSQLAKLPIVGSQPERTFGDLRVLRAQSTDSSAFTDEEVLLDLGFKDVQAVIHKLDDNEIYKQSDYTSHGSYSLPLKSNSPSDFVTSVLQILLSLQPANFPPSTIDPGSDSETNNLLSVMHTQIQEITVKDGEKKMNLTLSELRAAAMLMASVLAHEHQLLKPLEASAFLAERLGKYLPKLRGTMTLSGDTAANSLPERVATPTDYLAIAAICLSFSPNKFTSAEIYHANDDEKSREMLEMPCEPLEAMEHSPSTPPSSLMQGHIDFLKLLRRIGANSSTSPLPFTLQINQNQSVLFGVPAVNLCEGKNA